MTHPSSNEDTVAELEAAAAKWVLEKNKYTLECLRDARKAVLARMLSGDSSAPETKPTPCGRGEHGEGCPTQVFSDEVNLWKNISTD